MVGPGEIDIDELLNRLDPGRAARQQVQARVTAPPQTIPQQQQQSLTPPSLRVDVPTPAPQPQRAASVASQATTPREPQPPNGTASGSTTATAPQPIWSSGKSPAALEAELRAKLLASKKRKAASPAQEDVKAQKTKENGRPVPPLVTVGTTAQAGQTVQGGVALSTPAPTPTTDMPRIPGLDLVNVSQKVHVPSRPSAAQLWEDVRPEGSREIGKSGQVAPMAPITPVTAGRVEVKPVERRSGTGQVALVAPITPVAAKSPVAPIGLGAPGAMQRPEPVQRPAQPATPLSAQLPVPRMEQKRAEEMRAPAPVMSKPSPPMGVQRRASASDRPTSSGSQASTGQPWSGPVLNKRDVRLRIKLPVPGSFSEFFTVTTDPLPRSTPISQILSIFSRGGQKEHLFFPLLTGNSGAFVLGDEVGQKFYRVLQEPTERLEGWKELAAARGGVKDAKTAKANPTLEDVVTKPGAEIVECEIRFGPDELKSATSTTAQSAPAEKMGDAASQEQEEEDDDSMEEGEILENEDALDKVEDHGPSDYNRRPDGRRPEDIYQDHGSSQAPAPVNGGWTAPAPTTLPAATPTTFPVPTMPALPAAWPLMQQLSQMPQMQQMPQMPALNPQAPFNPFTDLLSTPWALLGSLLPPIPLSPAPPIPALPAAPQQQVSSVSPPIPLPPSSLTFQAPESRAPSVAPPPVNNQPPERPAPRGPNAQPPPPRQPQPRPMDSPRHLGLPSRTPYPPQAPRGQQHGGPPPRAPAGPSSANRVPMHPASVRSSKSLKKQRKRMRQAERRMDQMRMQQGGGQN